MGKIILYTYDKCSTCKKASRWLDQKNITYEKIDIIKEPPIVKYLELALKEFSSDKKKIFNTRGKSFKTINFDINEASRQEIIEVLRSDGKLIKRPFLVYEEKKIILGFNETEYIKNFF